MHNEMRNIINYTIKSFGLLSAMAILGQAHFAQAQLAPVDVDPPVTENIGAETEIRVVAPTNTFYGTRGLSQTASAEALGQGRLIFGLNGSVRYEAHRAAETLR
jgi:hypothetical protein